MKFIRFVKILTIISLFFIILALYIILKTPPATGYEISIYSAYPWFFWILILSSIAFGIFIMVFYAFKEDLKDRGWVFGLFLVVFSNLIIILLPIFRGYAFYGRSDALSHLGIVKDGIFTGSLGKNNFYPISHILAISIVYISGMDPITVVMIMPSLFYILYNIFLYLFAKTVTNKPGEAILIITFGSVLYFTYFSTWFLPTQFCFYFIPLIMFLIHKNIVFTHGPIGYKILFILVLIMIPFFHPFGVIFLIPVFIILAISSRFYNNIWKRNLSNIRQEGFKPYQSKGLLTYSLLVIYVFFVWISKFTIFNRSIIREYYWFLYQVGVPPTEMYSQQLSVAEFQIYELILLLIKNYGHVLIYIILSLISIFIVLRKTLFLQKTYKLYEIFFSLLFIVFGLMCIIFLFIDFYTSENPYRAFIWVIMWSTMLNGIVLHNWISTKLKSNKFKNRKFFKRNTILYLLTIIIVFSAFIGVFSTHMSPVILRANQQVTQMDLTGVEWFSEQKNPNIPVASLDQIIWRAPEAIWGFESIEQKSIEESYLPPPHFGYNINNTAANSFQSDIYLTINGYNRKMYKELYTDIGSFSNDDFERLNSDQAINKLYSNGELEIYHISAVIKE